MFRACGRLLARFWQQLSALVLIALGVWLYFWYFYDYAYTRDAYIYANVTNVASNVSGTIRTLYAKDNQLVHKGQLLFQIDPEPFDDKLERAQGILKQAQLNMSKTKHMVKVAIAKLNEKRTDLKNVRDHLRRLSKLYLEKAISQEAYVNAKAAVALAESEVAASEEQLVLAQQNVNNNQLLEAKAGFDNARFDVTQTQIKAPQLGYITNFQLSQGDYVRAGTPLFALVDTAHWWVIARFRETLVRLLHSGQLVSVRLDMYPGVVFHGVVGSIGWGINRGQSSPMASHSTLTYLSPTEDWIRITQRFPVRILLTPQKQYPFRVGASARVHVNVQ